MCKLWFVMKFDRLSLIGSILMIVSPFLPFWAGTSLVGGLYDMWVVAPSINYYGLAEFGPHVTVDMGWTTWPDVIMLSVGTALIFIASALGIFKSTIAGFLGIVGATMTLLSFIGFPSITYSWVWLLMGPAFFLLWAGSTLCLIALRRSQLRLALMNGKRALISTTAIISLISVFVVSLHIQAVASANDINYFDENLNVFSPSSSDGETRRAFLISLDKFIQRSYRQLPRFVEYSSTVGHG